MGKSRVIFNNHNNQSSLCLLESLSRESVRKKEHMCIKEVKEENFII